MNNEAKRILVVDDEEMIRDLLQETFSRRGFYVDVVEMGKEAVKKVEEDEYDLLIADIRLPDISGMKVLDKAKKARPAMGVIMITAYGSIKNAVKSLKQGAFDYITKPFNLDEIEMVVDKFFEFTDLKTENQYLRSELDKKFSFQNIVGSSDAMQKVFDAIQMVSRSRATVLIQGPSGTGKELAARAIHYNSNRKNGPFITTNCAALPEGLVESELFGHEKGAFTGAIKTSKGRFEMAHGGTLLLDEISEISLGLQAKLLRVLQEREIERVGGEKPMKVDVRIVATTNRDLQKEVEEGRFRGDLYYRLNVVPIHMPSLNERRVDVPLLVNHFIKKSCKENELPVKRVSESALKILSQREWPGNVREVENCMERAVVMSGTDVEILEIENFLLEESFIAQPQSIDVATEETTLRAIEKAIILKTLRENEDNRTRTSEILGISVRTLRNKLNEYREEGAAV